MMLSVIGQSLRRRRTTCLGNFLLAGALHGRVSAAVIMDG